MGEFFNKVIYFQRKKREPFHCNIVWTKLLFFWKAISILFVGAASFSWKGTGTPIFGASENNSPKTLFGKPVTPKKTNDDSDGDDDEEDEDEHDPQFEPVVPLPDLVTVRTGEEDEDKRKLSHFVLFSFSFSM